VSVIADRVSRFQVSDPKPARCAACYCSADALLRFIDFDADVNRGAIIEEGSGAVIDSIDELHLCENCVRDAAETLDYKPGLHANHLRLNRELMRDRDELRERVGLLERLVGEGAS
jgi:hypothetical protein